MTAIETNETTSATPWHLSGNQAPVFDELTVTDLEVVGAIPTDLAGRYFRNGANPQTGSSVHWFVGDGMVHGVELADGRANWYRNRYVRTPVYANPDRDRMEMAMDPETMAVDYRVSTGNTSVVGHAGKIFALEEGGFPYQLSPEIDTLGPWDFDGKLTTAMTAHPKVCPVTGELLMFGYGFLPPYLTYHRVDASGRLVQSEEISVTGPTMIHDFAISRNHAIFMDLPAVFDMELAMSGGMPIHWSDDYPARFGIMPRTGSDADVTWFDVEPCYVFHTLNAYDRDDTVVVEGCRMPEIWRESSAMEPGDGAADDSMSPALHRWTFDLASGTVSEERLDDQPSEFPRVPDSLVGLDGRYGYTMALAFGGGDGEILKYDLANGASKTVHRFPEGHIPGEPSFVPAEGATSEDDGWLLTFVYDGPADSSYLVVLDASDVAADPVAEIKLPRRVPTGFHGAWFADQP